MNCEEEMDFIAGVLKALQEEIKAQRQYQESSYDFVQGICLAIDIIKKNMQLKEERDKNESKNML